MSCNMVEPGRYSVTDTASPVGAERAEMLAESLVFLHLQDALAPVTLLECIASATPILINAIPAVRELLGNEYPLYYFSYLDAAIKAQNRNLVAKTHEYLKQLPCRQSLTVERFITELEQL